MKRFLPTYIKRCAVRRVGKNSLTNRAHIFYSSLLPNKLYFSTFNHILLIRTYICFSTFSHILPTMYNFKVETGDPHEFTMEVGGHRVTVPYLSPEEKKRYDERAKQEGPVTSIPDGVNFEALDEDLVKASAQYLAMMYEINEQHGGGPDQVPDFTPALALAQTQGLAPVPALGHALDLAWHPALAQAQAPALAPAPVPTYQMGGISANRIPSVKQRHATPGFGTDSPVLSRPHSGLFKGNSSMASPGMNRPYSGSVTDKPINGCTVPGCPDYGSSVSKCPINGCFIRGCPANTHPASGCPVTSCPINGRSSNGYTANGHHTNGYPAIGCLVTGCPAAGSLMKRCPVNGCFIKGCPTNTHPARGCQFIGCPANPSAKRYPA